MIPQYLYKRSDGQSSSSKFWLSVFNAIAMLAYAGIAYHQVMKDLPDLMGFGIFTGIMSVVITGNKLVSDLIKVKFGAGVNNDSGDNTGSYGNVQQPTSIKKPADFNITGRE